MEHLKLVEWAVGRGVCATIENDVAQLLEVDLSPRQVKMAHSTATGEALVSNGYLGADIIRLGAGEGFVPHTHPGDHLLIVLGGKGTITLGGSIYGTRAGQIYMVPGAVPHAVGAISDHVILAVGAQHKPVDSDERMAPVEYQAVISPLTGTIHCTICDKVGRLRRPLHTHGCHHCPCPECIKEAT